MGTHHISAARAQKFTIRIQRDREGTPRKIAKLFFGQRDGSLYLDFPYFKHPEGLVAHVRLAPGLSYPRDVSLEEGGKVTSHLVKYAHHRDGEAHFSQAGKVRTLVRRKAVPLNRAAGHLFTIQIQSLDGFDEGSGPDYDYDNIRDKPITFNMHGVEPQRAIKLVGFWHNRRELRRRVLESEVGPGVTLLSDEGNAYGLILSAPTGTPGAGSYLILMPRRIPPIAPNGSHLTFIGGFDARDVIHDDSRPTGFLALSYPAGDYERLMQEIGAIDLRRDELVDAGVT